MNADTRAEYIAICNICLLREDLKDCPRCRYNIGLAARILSRPYSKPDPELSERDCLHIQYAAFCSTAPLLTVDFSDIHDGLDRVEAVLVAEHADWQDEMNTRESVRPF